MEYKCAPNELEIVLLVVFVYWSVAEGSDLYVGIYQSFRVRHSLYTIPKHSVGLWKDSILTNSWNKRENTNKQLYDLFKVYIEFNLFPAASSIYNSALAVSRYLPTRIVILYPWMVT